MRILIAVGIVVVLGAGAAWFVVQRQAAERAAICEQARVPWDALDDEYAAYEKVVKKPRFVAPPASSGGDLDEMAAEFDLFRAAQDAYRAGQEEADARYRSAFNRAVGAVQEFPECFTVDERIQAREYAAATQ